MKEIIEAYAASYLKGQESKAKEVVKNKMYDINKLKQLRDETGISFSLCKKALEESKNDLELAKNYLINGELPKPRISQIAALSQGIIFPTFIIMVKLRL